jgi:hypothetical protein
MMDTAGACPASAWAKVKVMMIWVTVSTAMYMRDRAHHELDTVHAPAQWVRD